ncbi:MAG TPA: ATP-binding protein [Candidatus Obscuribacterales bacterium]
MNSTESMILGMPPDKNAGKAARSADDLGPILDASSDGILILDRRGTILFGNKAAARLLNKRQQDLVGWVFGFPIVRGNKTELEIARSGDTIKVVEMHVSSSSMRWHQIPVTVACLRDITEHVTLRRSLAERNEELLSLNRELRTAKDAALEYAKLKGEFVANVSHEIRTPMAGLVGMAEILTLDERLSADQRDVVEQIYASAKRLFRVLSDLLDFSRLEAGGYSVEMTDVDIAEMIRDVGDSILPSIREKKLTLETFIDKRLPPMLSGDELKIRHALLNLAHNAVKFTSEGRIRIAVDLVKTEGEIAHVRFSVEDSGIGIDEKDHHKLFQPFGQVDSSIKRVFGGTGLGLSITKRFVELLQGTIGFESALGKGSTFWFVLPLRIDAAQTKAS